MDKDIIIWLFGAAMSILSIILGFLKHQNQQQSKQIDTLFIKHDEDVAKLSNLELRIAQDHYLKSELDPKFEKLERAFVEGFKELGSKFDKLSERLLRHDADDGK